jgi:hypothetical protein
MTEVERRSTFDKCVWIKGQTLCIDTLWHYTLWHSTSMKRILTLGAFFSPLEVRALRTLCRAFWQVGHFWLLTSREAE